MNELLLNFVKARVPAWVLLVVAALAVVLPVFLALPKLLDAIEDLRTRWRLRGQKKVLEYILDVVVRHYQGYGPGGGGMGDQEFYFPRERLHDEAVRLGYLAYKGNTYFFVRTSKEYPKTPQELREEAKRVNPELTVPKKLKVAKFGYAGATEPRRYEVPDEEVAADGRRARKR